MKAYLVDGTYELFRAYYGAPQAEHRGREVGAARGLLRSLAYLLRDGVTHVGAAFDTVIESFRNELFAGYKTGDGIDPALFQQFELAERVSEALGIATWRMIDFEADDAIATAAHALAARDEVEQVIIASPDKDLCQCVRGARVICWDRLRDRRFDEAGVVAKFGIPPASIPDYLALVGDDADGIPGLPRWGARSAAQVLARWGSIDAIPDDPARWEVPVRGSAALAEALRSQREAARLYRTLATLRVDAPIDTSPEALAWRGADPERLAAICDEIGIDAGAVAVRARTSA